MGPKEKAYDDQIAPLMTQIITIAKEAGIPLLASFELDDDPESGPLACTTFILPGEASDKLKAAKECLYPERVWTGFTVVTRRA